MLNPPISPNSFKLAIIILLFLCTAVIVMLTMFVTPKFKEQILERNITKVKHRGLMAKKDEVAQRCKMLSERTSSHRNSC